MERKTQLMIGSGVLVAVVSAYFAWTKYSAKPEPQNVKLETKEINEMKEMKEMKEMGKKE